MDRLKEWLLILLKALEQIKLQEKSDISTQLALKHQQLMNIKMELVKRKLPKNFIHSKSSFKMTKINKTL